MSDRGLISADGLVGFACGARNRYRLAAKMREGVMDKDSIKNAEDRVAEMQDALDEAQRVLQAADRAQQAAEESAGAMRKVALAAACAVVLMLLADVMRRRRRGRDVESAEAG